jgi:hypothetical protein
MGATLNSLLSYLGGLFSRAFWFGSFLPIAVFAVVNFMFVVFVYDLPVNWSPWTKIGDGWQGLPLALLGLLVLTYAISPFVSALHGVLDGSLLPEGFHRLLYRHRRLEIATRRSQKQHAVALMRRFKRLQEAKTKDLAKARQAGLTQPQPVDANRKQAEFYVMLLEGTLADAFLPKEQDVIDAVEVVAKLLASARADRDVDDLWKRMIAVLEDAARVAEHEAIMATLRFRGLQLERPQATRIGDARAFVEGYSLAVYNVEFSYIWPRIQLVLKKEESLGDKILAARAQIDFSAVSMVLIVLAGLIWPPVLAFTTALYTPILLIGAVVPLLLVVFYELLFESEMAFAEVVRVVIDRHRLDLLTTVLRQPIPATSTTEREIWEALEKAEEGHTGEIVYRHPTPGPSR